jgi:hypothetical protein
MGVLIRGGGDVNVDEEVILAAVGGVADGSPARIGMAHSGHSARDRTASQPAQPRPHFVERSAE